MFEPFLCTLRGKLTEWQDLFSHKIGQNTRHDRFVNVVNLGYMYILADFKRPTENANSCSFISTKTNTRSEYACIQDAH